MAEVPRPGLLDLEKELTCSICTEVLYQPLTLLDCLHTFCGSCLKLWFGWQASQKARGDGTSFTCPSCRTPVRETRPDAKVTTLLDMFLQANPTCAKTAEEKEDIGKKYRPGEIVIPRAERRESVEDEDRRLIEEVRAMSLREVQGRRTRTYERGVRHTPREERRRRDASSSATAPATAVDSRSEARQIEHQSSLRSLIRTSDVDSAEIQEEILRQIEQDGLLDGIDIHNMDLSQEDELSERIAEAYRRRHSRRIMAPDSRTGDTRQHGRSSRGSESRNTAPRHHHARSTSDVGPPATSSHPPVSRPHLLEAYPTSQGHRRRTSSESRRQVSPTSAPSGNRTEATRSATDLSSRPRTADREAVRSVTDLTPRPRASNREAPRSVSDLLPRPRASDRESQRQPSPRSASSNTRGDAPRSASSNTRGEATRSATDLSTPARSSDSTESRPLDLISNGGRVTQTRQRPSSGEMQRDPIVIPISPDQPRQEPRVLSSTTDSPAQRTASPVELDGSTVQAGINLPGIFELSSSKSMSPLNSAVRALPSNSIEPFIVPVAASSILDSSSTQSPVTMTAPSRQSTASLTSGSTQPPTSSTASSKQVPAPLTPTAQSTSHSTASAAQAAPSAPPTRPAPALPADLSASTIPASTTPSPSHAEPHITCENCKKAGIQYELHLNCSICNHGDYNLCLRCYRLGNGCPHWYGFGDLAWQRFQQQASSHQQLPHTLIGHRYLRPKAESLHAAAETGGGMMSTEDPSKRLQSGAFCCSCSAYADECFWKCDWCNSGEWGFCNACVNRGKCCTHPLLPIAHVSAAKSKGSFASGTTGSQHSEASFAPITSARMVQAFPASNLSSSGQYRPLTFSTNCDVCRWPVAPSQQRYHCYTCNDGDYDVCAPCYAKLCDSGRISRENGERGWRRCLRGHRTVVVFFDDSPIGQRRVVLRDLVGGHGLLEEPGSADGRQKWTWHDEHGNRTLTVTRRSAGTSTDDSTASAPPPPPPTTTMLPPQYPPDGGVGIVAMARYAWVPEDGVTDELAFPRGAEIREAYAINEEWMCGCYAGTMGLVYTPYVHVIDVVKM